MISLRWWNQQHFPFCFHSSGYSGTVPYLGFSSSNPTSSRYLSPVGKVVYSSTKYWLETQLLLLYTHTHRFDCFSALYISRHYGGICYIFYQLITNERRLPWLRVTTEKRPRPDCNFTIGKWMPWKWTARKKSTASLSTSGYLVQYYFFFFKAPQVQIPVVCLFLSSG